MKLIKYKESIIDIENCSHILFIDNANRNYQPYITFTNSLGKYVNWICNDVEDFEIIKNKLSNLVDIDFNIEIEKTKDVVEDIDIE